MSYNSAIKLIGIASVTALCLPAIASPEDFPDGIEFGDPSRSLKPTSGDLGLSTINSMLWLSSGAEETIPLSMDGGIHLFGTPIRHILGAGASSEGSFEVWSFDDIFFSPPLDPLFAIDSAAETAAFNNVNVSINSGTLSVGGSPVSTTATLPTVLEGITGKVDIGNGTASGTNSVAIGLYSPVASNTGAVAIGKGTASGEYSFASGDGVKAIGRSSTALGYNSEAWGWYSVALGQASATGAWAFATGHQSSATGIDSVAMGSGIASGQGSIAMGTGVTARSMFAVTLGAHNKENYGSNTTWVGTDAIFTVGNGTTWGGPNQSDALKMLKNGKTTLINKTWTSTTPLADPNTGDSTDADGVALRVQGHTELQGKVTIAVAQGDISMGIYGN